MHCIYFPLHCQHYLHSSAWHHATPFPIRSIYRQQQEIKCPVMNHVMFYKKYFALFPPHISLCWRHEKYKWVKRWSVSSCWWEGSVLLLYNLQIYGILYMEMYESSSAGRDGLVFLSLNIIFSFTRPILNLWINCFFFLVTDLFFLFYYIGFIMLFFFFFFNESFTFQIHVNYQFQSITIWIWCIFVAHTHCSFNVFPFCVFKPGSLKCFHRYV